VNVCPTTTSTSTSHTTLHCRGDHFAYGKRPSSSCTPTGEATISHLCATLEWRRHASIVSKTFVFGQAHLEDWRGNPRRESGVRGEPAVVR